MPVPAQGRIECSKTHVKSVLYAHDSSIAQRLQGASTHHPVEVGLTPKQPFIPKATIRQRLRDTKKERKITLETYNGQSKQIETTNILVMLLVSYTARLSKEKQQQI